MTTDTLSTRRRGRPPLLGRLGPMSEAERQYWYRQRQLDRQRRMAALLLDLWHAQPNAWKDRYNTEHADILTLAQKLTADDTA